MVTKMLTIDAVLAATDIAEEVVDVPEWGGKVKIRALTKGQQIAVRKRASVGDRIDTNGLDVLLFIEGCVEPKFELHHIGDLLNKSSGPFDRVLKAIMALSGMLDTDAVDAEKDLKS